MPVPTPPRPRAVDLFSGCGGMTQGLKKAGFDVIAAVERESLAAETYRLNHPEVRLWEADIRGITPSAIKKAVARTAGDIDLLTGCPPCQSFSSIRRLNRRTQRDDRNNLLFDFLRFVKGLRPKVIMLENVPGLSLYWRWGEFIQRLESLGYVVSWEIVNAADFGVPQRRRRLVLMGSRTGSLPKALQAEKPATVRSAISHLPRPGGSGDPLHDFRSVHSPKVRSIIRRIPKDGGSRDALGKDQLKCHKNFPGFKDVYGRMSWNAVSPTITGGCINPSKGRFLHPTQNRAISLREAALLQTFPPRYRFSLRRGKHPAALLIGNALPPELARRHLAPIAKFLRRA